MPPARRRPSAAVCALLTLAIGWLAAPSEELRADALERLNEPRLARVHAAVEAFEAARSLREPSRPYREYRVNLHVHSAFSHDSRGELPAIVAAAKRAGTEVLMFTEHPADHYDFVLDGHRGLHDGVLCIPGAETRGLLTYPTASMAGQESLEPADFVRRVRQQGGLSFLSHLEERLDWELPGLTGCEIYNTHADAKEETQLFASLKTRSFCSASRQWSTAIRRRLSQPCKTTRGSTSIAGISSARSHRTRASQPTMPTKTSES